MPTSNHKLKIAVIGGGSTYTPELVEGLLSIALPVQEIVLHDILPEKLAVVGGLAQRMAAAADSGVRVTLTEDRARALDGADAVITQLRVGGLAARALDERIPLAHGLVGQETTGPGGFAKALRTIPVLLAIDREMAARCPDAPLINFTNPSGLVTEALHRQGRGRAVGLCNFPLTLKMKAAEALGVSETQVSLAYFGLNHLSWARVLVDGEDRTIELIEIMIAQEAHRELTGYAFAPDVLRGLGLLPSGYLRYYYETEAMVAQQQAAPQTRAERLLDLEQELLAQYADPKLQEKPAGLQERGGAWYSTAAVRLLRALWSDTPQEQVLNVPNDGAIPFLPDDVIVEVPALVAARRVQALPAVEQVGRRYTVNGHPVPREVVTLIQRVKQYEILAVEAAVTGNWAVARQALAAHPLLDGRHEVIPTLLHDLLHAHRAHLPQFFPGG